MIDPMQKITIACLAKDRQQTVEKLRELGTLHVTPWKTPVSPALDALRKRQDDLTAVIGALAEANKVPPATLPAMSPAALLDCAVSALAIRKQTQEEMNQATAALKLLEPWGSFRKEQLAEMEARGLHAYLCVLPEKSFAALPAGEARKVISVQDGLVHYVVFSLTPLEENKLPLAQLPANTSVSYWEERLERAKESRKGADAQLAAIAKEHAGEFKKLAEGLENEIRFATARDSMGDSGKLLFLKGYAPTEHLEAIRAAAHQNGWAIRYEDVPEDDEFVPTNLKIAKPFRMAKAIFDFVGILPGYHEVDVSIVVMVFLSIFCGMLVGDAGYGVLFALAALFGLWKVKSKDVRPGLQLLLIMSGCIILYGALTGTWFGMSLGGLEWFRNGENDSKGNAHIQMVCFFLGATQMSLACAWQAILALKQLSFKDDTKAFLLKLRTAVGQIGWGLFLWANFGLAKLLVIDGKPIDQLPGLYCVLFAVGFVIILICGIDWTNMGDVIYMPFTFINCFVDVLSYIRLFAVGLSSMYIAQCFNDMGRNIYQSAPWAIPLVVLLLALGHLLNIALACMGVLVHGIRLNTLEFSGHMNISWSGKPYTPLK